MKKAVALLVVIMLVLSISLCAFAEDRNTELVLIKNEEDTAAHSMHRGLLAEVPCVTVNTVTLKTDGSYLWEKVLKSADGSDSVYCRYLFEGTYENAKKNRVSLSAAVKCTFEENYGAYDGVSPIGLLNNRKGDEQTDPSCLEYFNTPYLVYNGNVEAKIKPDSGNGTFDMADHSDQWEYIWQGENEKHIVKWIAEQYELCPLGEIVFYGASNFRLWTNMEEDMKPYAVQNHGIGGSNDLELMEFADRLLYPFKPSAVFIQTGSNDYTQGATMEEVFANKEKMFGMFRETLPDTVFFVMAGLPLPGRMEYWDLTVEVNDFLKSYCEEHENMVFVDGTDGILTDEGPEELATGDGRFFNPDNFIADQIHLTQGGHDIWTQYMFNALHENGY